MAESFLGLLAFLVFGIFWISSQDWFDFLPRRVTRRVGYAGLALLMGSAYLAPTALRSGMLRWMTYETKQMQEKLQHVFGGMIPQSPRPGQTPTSTPRP